MSPAETRFNARRRRAEAEIFPDALAAHGDRSVQRLDRAYRDLLANWLAPAGPPQDAAWRDISPPSTRWIEILDNVRDAMRFATRVFVDETGSSADPISLLCSRSVIAVATFLRVTAGQLQDAADDMVETTQLDPIVFGVVEDSTTEAYDLSSLLLGLVETERWDDLLEWYRAELVEPESSNLHEIARPWAMTSSSRPWFPIAGRPAPTADPESLVACWTYREPPAASDERFVVRIGSNSDVDVSMRTDVSMRQWVRLQRQACDAVRSMNFTARLNNRKLAVKWEPPRLLIDPVTPSFASDDCEDFRLLFRKTMCDAAQAALTISVPDRPVFDACSFVRIFVDEPALQDLGSPPSTGALNFLQEWMLRRVPDRQGCLAHDPDMDPGSPSLLADLICDDLTSEGLLRADRSRVTKFEELMMYLFFVANSGCRHADFDATDEKWAALANRSSALRKSCWDSWGSVWSDQVPDGLSTGLDGLMVVEPARPPTDLGAAVRARPDRTPGEPPTDMQTGRELCGSSS